LFQKESMVSWFVQSRLTGQSIGDENI